MHPELARESLTRPAAPLYGRPHLEEHATEADARTWYRRVWPAWSGGIARNSKLDTLMLRHNLPYWLVDACVQALEMTRGESRDESCERFAYALDSYERAGSRFVVVVNRADIRFEL